VSKRKYGLGLSAMLAAGTLLAACGSDEETPETGGNAGEGDAGTEETADFSVAMVTDVG